MYKTLSLLIIVSAPLVVNAERINNTTFGIFPLFGVFTGSAGSLTEAEAKQEIQDLKNQVGENKGLFRVGFAGIFSNETTLRRNTRLLKEANLSHVPIVSVQTHHITTDIKNLAYADLRNFQWRQNGINWTGTAGPEDRDKESVTPSRYATELRAQFETNVKDKKIKPIKKVMDEFSGTIVEINASIEMGLTDAASNAMMGDYSPYAITEFRDWLKHSGMYDALNGKYTGEGASSHIVGTYININGKMRSQFYDDPSPTNANGTGVSFNEKFGTNFKTWKIKYYDLVDFPAKITDQNVNLSPTSGTGFIKDGFDAPRVVNANNTYWKAWSWDVKDQGDTYPAGDPVAPAFGFRQVMVHNYVNDILQWIHEAGIPKDMITAHQVPAELLSSDVRARVVASPLWTGVSKLDGSLGITRYGTLPTSFIQKINSYSKDWGIYEWHPMVHPAPTPEDDAKLKTRVKQQIDAFYKADCRTVCPFSWQKGAGGLKEGSTFAALYPVKGTGFTAALKEWLNEQPGYKGPVITPTTNRAPTISFVKPTQSTFNVNEGYQLGVEALPVDLDSNLAYTVLYIDGDSIRKESVAPYEWGLTGTPTENELNNLAVGTHKIKVVAVDSEGLQGSAEFTLIVNELITNNKIDQKQILEVNSKTTQNLSIYDIRGNLIHSANGLNFDFSRLTKGIYFLRTKNKDEITVKKIQINN